MPTRSRGHRSRSRDAARPTLSTSGSMVDDVVEGDGLKTTEASWSSVSAMVEQLQSVSHAVDVATETWSTAFINVASSTTVCPALTPTAPTIPKRNRSAQQYM